MRKSRFFAQRALPAMIMAVLGFSCALPFEFPGIGASPRPSAPAQATPAPTPTPEPGGPGSRPNGNTGVGFYVSGSKIYDPNGQVFRIQGVNANHWWNTGSDNRDAVPYIKAFGANAARLVFGFAQDPAHPEYDVCQTQAERRAVVEEYIKYHIVPIVELHNATGSNDPALVTQAADFWIGESWVKDLEKQVIVNITNEWCNVYQDSDGRTGSDEVWRDAYLGAIARLRAAGVRNALVIDSINWASSISPVEKYGQALLDADPQHNLIFSLHMYGGWRAPGDPDDDPYFSMNVDVGLDRLIAKGLPVIVGEFSHDCSVDLDPEAAQDSELIEAFDARGTGYLFWMWYNSAGHYQNMVRQSASYLSTESGRVIGAYLSGAREASSFPAALPALPARPAPNPGWKPQGPLSAVVSNSWWMSASLPNMDDIAFIDLELPDGTAIPMAYQWWGVYALNVDLSAYLNQTVRFAVGSAAGDTVRTSSAVLRFDNSGDDDTTEFAIP